MAELAEPGAPPPPSLAEEPMAPPPGEESSTFEAEASSCEPLRAALPFADTLAPQLPKRHARACTHNPNPDAWMRACRVRGKVHAKHYGEATLGPDCSRPSAGLCGNHRHSGCLGRGDFGRRRLAGRRIPAAAATNTRPARTVACTQGSVSVS